MKRLFLSLLLLAGALNLPAADQIITGLITITNNPVLDGDTLTVNGSTRTWKATVTSAPVQYQIGASIGANATNLFSQIAAYPYSGLTVGRSGTNGITLRTLVNGGLTISILTNWGTYSTNTQTVTALQVIRVPFSSVPGDTNRTNQASLLVRALNDYSTNSFDGGLALFVHYLTDVGTQTMGGDKTFTGLITFSGGADMFGAVLNQAEITNSHLKFKDLATTSPNHGHATFRNAADAQTFDLYSVAGVPTLSGALTTPTDLALLNRTNAEVVLASLVFENTFDSDQDFNGTNHTFNGNITVTSFLDTQGTFSTERANITSLANGANSGVNLDGNSFFKISTGPTGAFSLAGVSATNAKNGERKTIYNAVAQNLTISHQSGTEATPANRIITMSGADVVSTTACAFDLIYDSDSARWLLISFQD